MASKNQLLGRKNVAEEKVEKQQESLELFRHDCPEGRVFPPEMVKMMKYKGWKEAAKVVPKEAPEPRARARAEARS